MDGCRRILADDRSRRLVLHRELLSLSQVSSLSSSLSPRSPLSAPLSLSVLHRELLSLSQVSSLSSSPPPVCGRSVAHTRLNSTRALAAHVALQHVAARAASALVGCGRVWVRMAVPALLQPVKTAEGCAHLYDHVLDHLFDQVLDHLLDHLLALKRSRSPLRSATGRWRSGSGSWARTRAGVRFIGSFRVSVPVRPPTRTCRAGRAQLLLAGRLARLGSSPRLGLATVMVNVKAVY